MQSKLSLALDQAPWRGKKEKIGEQSELGVVIACPIRYWGGGGILQFQPPSPKMKSAFSEAVKRLLSFA